MMCNLCADSHTKSEVGYQLEPVFAWQLKAYLRQN